MVGVSSLTNRYWTGAIQLYKKTTKDIDSVEYRSFFEVTTDCSVSNLKSLSKTNRIISTFDSGIKIKLQLQTYYIVFVIILNLVILPDNLLLIIKLLRV